MLGGALRLSNAVTAISIGRVSVVDTILFLSHMTSRHRICCLGGARFSTARRRIVGCEQHGSFKKEKPFQDGVWPLDRTRAPHSLRLVEDA